MRDPALCMKAYNDGFEAYSSDLDVLEGDEYARKAYPEDNHLQEHFQDGWMTAAMDGDDL